MCEVRKYQRINEFGELMSDPALGRWKEIQVNVGLERDPFSEGKMNWATWHYWDNI